ncbi:MAG: type II toxin-antitoxin system RatA family toxin [Rickettsiales bacterium]|jgi:coenzyme Q-binding protein COQ10
MPHHTEQQFSPYTPQQIFALVADIEKYPEFLPWCRAARVIERSENEFLGELIISFIHITEQYTSRVTLTSPQDGVAGTIDVVMTKGPFEHLTNHWKFTAIDGGTRIDFSLDFKFRSRILEKLIGSLFSKATNKMVTAFKKRATDLYGNG